MMDKINLLEKYFNSFINLENDKDFFIGMADYLELLDSFPETDSIISKIFVPRQEMIERLKILEKPALDKLKEVREQLTDYITKNKIGDNEVLDDLRESEGWLTGMVVGSNSLVIGLYITLGDVIWGLYKIPEHKEFASSFIDFYKDSQNIKHYLKSPEIIAYQELEQEMNRKKNTELWGQLEEIINIFVTIKRGRENYKELVKKRELDKTTQATFDIMNYSIPVAEWASIEEGRNRHRENVLFDTKKIRPWMIRLNNYLLREYALEKPENY